MKPFNIARKYGAKIATAATLSAGTVMAHAADSTGYGAVLDSIDLSGVATKVGALAIVIVGIALVFKGPDIAKRIIRKV